MGLISGRPRRVTASVAASGPGRRRRRLWVGVGAVVVALAASAAVFWFAFVPNWRPPLREGERYGIDVSAHQGEIDWPAVASDDIEFAYVKATEGGDFTDVRFRRNWADAAAAGLDRGAYHFFTLCRPGRDQARHFLSVVPPDPAALPPAVDLELAGNCSRRPPPPAVEAEVRAFLGIVESAWGRPALLYVGDDWERRYPVRTRLDRLLWHLRFLRRPDVGNWHVWQVHGFARVDGVSGGVDLDIMRPAARPP